MKSPLHWILAATFVLRIVGIGWGLPASDGWDNDGVAPRDFLAGLVQTFTPGKFYVYPPLHLLALGLLTLPVTAIALVKAPSLAPPDVIHEIIRVPYMTLIAYAARLTSVMLSLGIVYAIAKTAEELRGRRAGWCAAAVCAVNAPLTYYSKTSNLDVPSLFWECLAVLALVRAVARRQPRQLRVAAALAVLAVATKDQAYAVFVLSVPATIALWIAFDPWARTQWRTIARELVTSALLGGFLLLIVDGIIFNPRGFHARLAFLVGPASQDFATYANDWVGRAAVIKDCVADFGRFYPWVFGAFVLIGVAIQIRASKEINATIAGFIPALAALSFTIAFNCMARRTDHRFLLPQAVFVATYAGIAIDLAIFEVPSLRVRRIAQVLIAAGFAAAIYGCMAVDASLLLDCRYDAEKWLSAHVAPGETIEVHGLNVYLPRLPPAASVTRIGPDPVDRRNPLPGVVEVQGSYRDATVRRPRFIVVSDGWVWRYLWETAEVDGAPKRGHIRAATQMSDAADGDGVTFFRQLFDERAGYRLAHASRWTSKLWPLVDYHASTSQEIRIFERQD